MSIVHVMSAKSAASLSLCPLGLLEQSLRLHLHRFTVSWKDEIPIFSYKLNFLRNLARTRATHVEI